MLRFFHRNLLAVLLVLVVVPFVEGQCIKRPRFFGKPPTASQPPCQAQELVVTTVRVHAEWTRGTIIQAGMRINIIAVAADPKDLALTRSWLVQGNLEVKGASQLWDPSGGLIVDVTLALTPAQADELRCAQSKARLVINLARPPRND